MNYHKLTLLSVLQRRIRFTEDVTQDRSGRRMFPAHRPKSPPCRTPRFTFSIRPFRRISGRAVPDALKGGIADL